MKEGQKSPRRRRWFQPDALASIEGKSARKSNNARQSTGSSDTPLANKMKATQLAIERIIFGYNQINARILQPHIRNKSNITFALLSIFAAFFPISKLYGQELRLNLMKESPFLYKESYDILEDVKGCPILSEVGIDKCLFEIQQHFSPNLDRVNRAILSLAQSQPSSLPARNALARSDMWASRAYERLRNANCDRLSYSAVGNRWHIERSVWACQFWMDLRRRSMLRETVGMAPMRVKSGRDDPRGPYRLVDIWRRVGTSEDRSARLQRQEQLSLARLASAKRRVRRVLDDWDEAQNLVDIAEREFRQSGPAFVRYRRAQCDNYTPKLAAAFGPTPTPEEAATACRILVNIEQATLLRYTFDNQPLLSEARERGEPHKRRPKG